MTNSINNLDSFSSSSPDNLYDTTVYSNASTDTVSKQTYYNGMFYMINKYLLAKSRFYNSANSTDNPKPGIEQLADLFTDSGDYKVSSFVKLLLFIVILLSIYLILRGLSTITNAKSSGELNKQGYVSFIVVWSIIVIISVISKTSNIKNYFTLFSSNTYKLNEPCETNIGSKVSNLKYWISIISVFILLIFLWFTNKFWHKSGKNSSAKGYFMNFGIIILFSMAIAWISAPNFMDSEETKFKMSYEIDGSNELPFNNTWSESKINSTFWILIFMVLIIASLSGAIMKVIKKDAKLPPIFEPWLRLRGLFFIAFNLLLIYYVPYYLIFYPIVCMLQRLLMGSLILPRLLERIPGIVGNGKSFSKMDPSEKLVLFNAFVGWDLPGWSFVKIIDVLEKILTGKDPSAMMKGEQSEQNTANINVFTEFGESSYLSPLFGFFYTLWPPIFYKLFKSYLSSNGKSGKDLGIGILALLLGLFISVWLTSIIFTYLGSKELEFGYPIPAKSKSKKWAWGIYATLYIITFILLLLRFFNIDTPMDSFLNTNSSTEKKPTPSTTTST